MQNWTSYKKRERSYWDTLTNRSGYFFVPQYQYQKACPMLNHIKFTLYSSLLGSFVSILFILANNLLSQDNLFEFWEFLLTLFIPSLTAIIFAKIFKLRLVTFIAIGNLTFIIPILGASFGASGSEPFISYALLGLAGGAFWSFPFILYNYIKK